MTAVTTKCDRGHSSKGWTHRYLLRIPGQCLALAFDRLKRAMKRKRAQHNRSLPFGSRALGLALVIVLLSLQQAWAAAFCLCDDQGRSQAATNPCEHKTAPGAEHHPGMHHHASAEMPHGRMHHESSQATRPASESENVSETGGQPGSNRPSTLSCCCVQPQADVPVASYSFQQQSLEAVPSLPQPATRTVEPLPATGIPKPPRARPVYLTVSAFLI